MIFGVLSQIDWHKVRSELAPIVWRKVERRWKVLALEFSVKKIIGGLFVFIYKGNDDQRRGAVAPGAHEVLRSDKYRGVG